MECTIAIRAIHRSVLDTDEITGPMRVDVLIRVPAVLVRCARQVVTSMHKGDAGRASSDASPNFAVVARALTLAIFAVLGGWANIAADAAVVHIGVRVGAFGATAAGHRINAVRGRLARVIGEAIRIGAGVGWITVGIDATVVRDREIDASVGIGVGTAAGGVAGAAEIVAGATARTEVVVCATTDIVAAL